MTTYVVFLNRKKRHEETIKQYIEATVLGTVESPNIPKAIRLGAETFHVEQITIEVAALSRATVFQQDYLKKTGVWKPTKASEGKIPKGRKK